jgi:hypothetical protein
VFQLRIARDLFALEGEPERAAVAEALAAFPPGASSPDLDAVRTLVG